MQQEQQWQQDKLDEDREEIVVQRPQLKQRPKIKIKTPNNRKKSHPNGPKIMKRTAPIVPPTKYEKDGKTQAEVIVDRQRQRIQVLEQQLLDQKLLFLAHRKSTIASISNGDPAIAPAALDVLCDDDERIGTDANDERGAYDRAVNISVKCLHMPEIQRGDDAKEQQTEKRRIPIVPARLDFRLLPDDTVLHLKQSLKTRTGVPIDHQILVASCVGRGSPAIRLRNDAVLREYAEKTGVGNRWTLTLLIGQSIPLYCKTSAT
ncbi:leucine rich repeat [Phytophthora boehmeriae]|uniref:Leucine rich repeat n=1 Tax=Phytophthora boehmeriae TaxID=109152 RepID=A0A8T1WWW4_9STRA|nr:leucine rich repeat [Phytophthora boehmeriae]